MWSCWLHTLLYFSRKGFLYLGEAVEIIVSPCEVFTVHCLPKVSSLRTQFVPFLLAGVEVYNDWSISIHHDV